MALKLKREPMAVGLVVLGIIAAYAWSGRYWVDLVDEGYFLDLGDRVLHGALPYRDFATYYTPGTFYLFALVFKLFGVSILPIRLLMAVLRGACALLLYRLTRRVAPWPLAWLPFAVIAALDAWPVEPEPHPSWPSIVACLATIELIVKHLETRRLAWLALAGLVSGLGYLFKQNIGAFTVLGVAGYVLLRPRADAGRTLRLARLGFGLGSAVAVSLLVRSNLDPLSAGAVWLPVLVTLGLLTFRAGRASPVAEGSVVLDAAAALGGFTLVTLLWLAPLVLALGPNQTPFGLFAGSVDQAAIATPFAAFTDGTPGLLLAVVWLSVGLLLGHVRHGRALAITAVALSLLIVALPHWQGPRDQLTLDPVLSPPLTWLDDNFGTLHLYLPALAGWAGIAGLFFLGNGDGPLPWYVLFGTLAALTMYPRADTLHTIVSSPPVLVAAAGALAQLWRGLLGQPAWRRAGVFAALLLLPVAALAPQVVWRLATFVSPEDNAQRLDYQPLGLPTAPVLVPRQQAEDIRAAVSYVQAGTPPGAPLFVYPVAPLFNFLAQRPNPTRFDHFLPGTLTAADFDQTIDELQHARPRYVLWDHHGVQVWGTDPANRPLSDYLWRCYAEVAAFRPYLVLERRPDAC